MADMMDMAAAMMAFQRQAAEQIQACNAALAASGLGFSADDRAVIAASAAAHPYPPGYDPNAQASPEVIAGAREAAAKAAEAEYPRDGFASDDARLQPVEGISIAHYAGSHSATLVTSRSAKSLDRHEPSSSDPHTLNP